MINCVYNTSIYDESRVNSYQTTVLGQLKCADMLMFKQILRLWRNFFEKAECQDEKSSGQEVGAVSYVRGVASGDVWVSGYDVPEWPWLLGKTQKDN